MHGLYKLLHFNRLRGHGIRIADSVCRPEVAGNIAHCPRQATVAPPPGKPLKATAKPYSRHILGIYSGVQSHPKATLKPPQGHLKAPPKRHQSATKATPKPHQSHTKAISTGYTSVQCPGTGYRPWASATAPLPRPPQPIGARRMALSSAAWTQGMLTPAKAEAAATALPRARNSQRERLWFLSGSRTGP